MNKLSALMAGAAFTLVACGGSEVSQSDDVSFEPGDRSETAGAPTTEAVVEVDPPATTPETDAPATDAVVAGDADGVLRVPSEYGAIQEAVDAAVPGDLVLVAPGVYHEAVDVVTDEIVIRGIEREGVVLDGRFELDNGIRVLGARGVAVENLTTQNYSGNGVFFISADGYRVSYVTAYRLGDYGIYAFDSVNGQIEHSYGAGSPDAGLYIGQCYPCNAVVDDVVAEHNGVGFFGTNAGGNLAVVNSTFRFNRVGIVPNSGSYELCYPQRESTIVGNTVHANNNPNTPAIDLARQAMGNGVVVAGGIGNVVERNLIYDHDKTGIAVVPFFEEGANDDMPTRDEWTRTCDEQRAQPLAEEIPERLVWESYDNTIRANSITDSRVADIGVEAVSEPTAGLGNCFEANDITTSAPAGIETLAPCGAAATPADDPAWAVEPLGVSTWLAEADSAPPAVDYEIVELPPIPDLDDMPDAATAPAEPAIDMPRAIDIDAIPTPTR